MKKTRLSLRLTAVLLSLILTMISIPLVATAENEIIIDNETSVQNTEATAPASDELIEDMSKRDGFTKHYVAPGGERYAVVFAEQMHYNDGTEWQEVDNRLTLDATTQRYVTQNSLFSVEFSKNTDTDQLVSIDDGEHTLSWSVLFPAPSGGTSTMSAIATV